MRDRLTSPAARTPASDIILGQYLIYYVSGILPVDAKTLPESLLTYHGRKSLEFHV